MKRTIAHILLFVYALALIKPVTPLINDIVAHSLWKIEHLATVHYENGKYHLHNELKEEAKEDANDKKPTAVKIYETVSVHITDNTTYQFAYNPNHKYIYSKKLGTIIHQVIKKDSPPPDSHRV